MDEATEATVTFLKRLLEDLEQGKFAEFKYSSSRDVLSWRYPNGPKAAAEPTWGPTRVSIEAEYAQRRELND